MKKRRVPCRKPPYVRISLSVVVVLLVVCALAGLRLRHSAIQRGWVDIAQEDEPLDASSERDGKWYGLCKKDSIRSVDDLHAAVANDSVLKVHFADFKWETATIESLKKPIFAYVYFRKADRLFQKAKPVMLPAGDQYITDGKMRVRTHCCNDFAEEPLPVVQSESEQAAPEEGALADAPGIALLPAGTDSPVSPLPTPPPSGSTAWLWPAAGGALIAQGKDNNDSPPPLITPPPVTPPPPTVVPEPKASLLVGFGLGVMAMMAFTLRFLARRRRG